MCFRACPKSEQFAASNNFYLANLYAEKIAKAYI